jgi:hypothetical protein
VGEWLVERFSIFGFHVQNWMVLAIAIVASWDRIRLAYT